MPESAKRNKEYIIALKFIFGYIFYIDIIFDYSKIFDSVSRTPAKQYLKVTHNEVI